MGGEKFVDESHFYKNLGSPPHGRGKDEDCPVAEPLEGITPALAGKRPLPSSGDTREWDHPRMGGEKPFLFYGGSSDSGSPPHGRGKDFMFCGQHLEIRITPAWAGKRRSQGAAALQSGDHPRVGGEKIRQSIWYRTT